MTNKDLFRIGFISAFLLLWGIGGILIDDQLAQSGLYIKGVASGITITIWSAVCTLTAAAIWQLFIKDKNNENLSPETVLLKAKIINNTFKKWLKSYDDDATLRESAGIKDLYCGVNKNDPSEIIILMQAKPGAILDFMKENSGRIASTGQVIGSEEISYYSP